MYKLKTLETGFFRVDGGAMFGAIPKKAWSKKYPCDDSNLCRLSLRCVLAISSNRKILIDTGIRYEDIQTYSYYGFTEVKQIDDCLQEIGLRTDEITDVVLTHLHFDHCAASVRKDEKGECLPMFPQAQYWCSRAQWKAACHPNLLEADSFCQEEMAALMAAGKLTLIDEGLALDEHFYVKIFDGHTDGQLACYINGEKGNYLIPSDVIPTVANVPLTWLSAYDIHAAASVQSKMELLKEAIAADRELIFYHDAYRPSAKVVKSGEFLYTVKRK